MQDAKKIFKRHFYAVATVSMMFEVTIVFSAKFPD